MANNETNNSSEAAQEKVVKTVSGETKKNKTKESAVDVPKEFASLIEQLDKLSALQISKFVKFLEKYWGVSSAQPVAAMAVSPAGGTDTVPVSEEKTEFDVILKEAGAQKVAVIKAVKDITGLGLGEAKAIVDSVPKVVKEKFPKDEAEAAKKTLEEAGAVVELA